MEEDLRSSGAGLRGFKSHPRHHSGNPPKQIVNVCIEAKWTLQMARVAVPKMVINGFYSHFDNRVCSQFPSEIETTTVDHNMRGRIKTIFSQFRNKHARQLRIFENYLGFVMAVFAVVVLSLDQLALSVDICLGYWRPEDADNRLLHHCWHLLLDSHSSNCLQNHYPTC
jgi:hypothetical protein